MVLDIAVTECPDLIPLDLRMPIMNGEEVMRQLKADPHTRNIPVVVLTASTMRGECELLLASGFDGYIGKPIDVTSFAARIAEFLPYTEPNNA